MRHRVAHAPKRSKGSQPTSVTVTAPAAASAVCEDASTPTLGSEGFTCADGTEPTCADGAEPTPASGGSTAVCPASPASSVEWSEASCEDDSTPTLVNGAYACEGGSQPMCEAESQPPGDAGPTLSCITYGTGPSESPSSAGEGSQAVARALAASGS